MFSIFINDLATGLKDMDLGISINGEKVPILLYADDVVTLSNDEREMQHMLNYVNAWCNRWQMAINMAKSKVMHFRPKNTNRCIMRKLYFEQVGGPVHRKL